MTFFLLETLQKEYNLFYCFFIYMLDMVSICFKDSQIFEKMGYI